MKNIKNDKRFATANDSIQPPSIIGIIPARYASERLPGKPLADIGGLPMVVRVWKNICMSKYISKLYVATDDKRIATVCEQYQCPFIMTSTTLRSGTERVYAAYKQLSENKNEKYFNENDIIVNIQGDEPLLNYTDIDTLVENFIKTNYDIGTLIARFKTSDDILNTSNVKVVLNKNHCAMYFSRSPIPFIRDINTSEWYNEMFWKHIGIYAYRKTALEKFVELEISELEQKEKLEQLRLLEQGYSFFCVEQTQFEARSDLISVDTIEDLEKVRNLF